MGKGDRKTKRGKITKGSFGVSRKRRPAMSPNGSSKTKRRAGAKSTGSRAAKKPDEKDKARVSSTDPEARVMKMPDGGYRPAYNWQFGLELSNFVITGVDVVNTGSDKAQMEPMVKQVIRRTGQIPKNW